LKKKTPKLHFKQVSLKEVERIVGTKTAVSISNSDLGLKTDSEIRTLGISSAVARKISR